VLIWVSSLGTLIRVRIFMASSKFYQIVCFSMNLAGSIEKLIKAYGRKEKYISKTAIF
jgi:hypothetical protein